MSDDTRYTAQQLNDAACGLAQEIWDKKWAHVSDLRSKPVGDCAEIVRELERRCPGFQPDDYKRAIARGMFGMR
tara:strand:+ start:134 stop:355 length:222 start_codon:yes stop_codon:yes gene_type:complete